MSSRVVIWLALAMPTAALARSPVRPGHAGNTAVLFGGLALLFGAGAFVNFRKGMARDGFGFLGAVAVMIVLAIVVP